MQNVELEQIFRARAQLRARWHREGWYRNESVGQTLMRLARERPDTPFHFHTEHGLRRSSTAEIVGDGARMARALAAIGIRPGDVVAFQLPTSYETAVLYAAAFCAGATVLPIVHFYGPAEVGFILRRARARALIVPDRWRHVDYLERLSALGDTPDLEHVIIVGERAPAGAQTLARLREKAADPVPVPKQDPDATCLMLFTSGTTGEPKGVQQTHNTLTCEWYIPNFLRKPGTFLNPTPAGHIQGFNFLMRPMVRGYPVVHMDRWDAPVAAELIDRLGVNQSGGAPYFLLTLVEAARAGGHSLASLRQFGLGGATVTPEHVRMADRLGIIAGRTYGSSEHSTVSSYDAAMSLERRSMTDGKILPGTEVRIVDDEDRDLPFGSDGEILLIGPEQFPAYLDDVHNRTSFTADGWFRSGDVGCVDAQGFLTITDRKKDLIIRGGENISSMEVENILITHPAVAEAAVVAMPDPRFGERVCAYAVLKPGAQLDFEQMRAHYAASGFAKQKTPEHLVLVSELPRTPTGKIRKNELRARLRA
ncbi:MAG: AMP-binding protein [Gammaproteobacteria bacterium]